MKLIGVASLVCASLFLAGQQCVAESNSDGPNPQNKVEKPNKKKEVVVKVKAKKGELKKLKRQEVTSDISKIVKADKKQGRNEK